MLLPLLQQTEVPGQVYRTDQGPAGLVEPVPQRDLWLPHREQGHSERWFLSSWTGEQEGHSLIPPERKRERMITQRCR